MCAVLNDCCNHNQYMTTLYVCSPNAGLPCELGAAAVSASDGNLTSVVLACPPAACLGTACPGDPLKPPQVAGSLDTLSVNKAADGLSNSVFAVAMHAWAQQLVFVLSCWPRTSLPLWCKHTHIWLYCCQPVITSGP